MGIGTQQWKFLEREAIKNYMKPFFNVEKLLIKLLINFLQFSAILWKWIENLLAVNEMVGQQNEKLHFLGNVVSEYTFKHINTRFMD